MWIFVCALLSYGSPSSHVPQLSISYWTRSVLRFRWVQPIMHQTPFFNFLLEKRKKKKTSATYFYDGIQDIYTPNWNSLNKIIWYGRTTCNTCIRDVMTLFIYRLVHDTAWQTVPPEEFDPSPILRMANKFRYGPIRHWLSIAQWYRHI